MANIDKLTQIASSELKAGEEFKHTTAGKTVVSSAGGEIVDGFIGATDHNVIILVYSLFGTKRLQCFAHSQTAIPSFNEDENSIALGLPGGETFLITEVLTNPKPKDLIDFIKKKRAIERTTFEATNIIVPAKK